MALVFNPDLGHPRAVILCGMWAEGKGVVWTGAVPEKKKNNYYYEGVKHNMLDVTIDGGDDGVGERRK